MNIGLIFIDEAIENNRQEKQKENDKIIFGKLGSINLITKFFSYISQGQ